MINKDYWGESNYSEKRKNKILTCRDCLHILECEDAETVDYKIGGCEDFEEENNDI